jgi:hypothetical protein
MKIGSEDKQTDIEAILDRGELLACLEAIGIREGLTQPKSPRPTNVRA